MKTGMTHVAMLLDRSGSMGSLRSDTIGGVNRFLDDQRAVPGEALVTIAQFDHEYLLTCDGVRVQEVPKLTTETYSPRGNTALLDSFSRLIDEVGSSIEKLAEDDRPEQVVFVVVTDGQENASREVSAAALRAKVKHQEERYSWKFIFLGANMDALAAGGAVGVRGVNFQATPQGMASSLDAASAYVGNSRMGNSADAHAVLNASHVDDAASKSARARYRSALSKAPK